MEKCKTLCTRTSLLLLLQTAWLVASTNGGLAFLGQQPFRAFVSQGSQNGGTVYQFFVVEEQLNNEEPAGITYSSPHANSLPFVLVPASGQLLITGALVNEEYTFTVEASLDTVTIATNITVIIVPLSDTAPRFEHTQYNVEVSENLPTRQAFSVIRAFSLSPGATTQRYSIVVGNTNSDFSINSISGLLRVDRALDREQTDTYLLTVRYIDDLMSVDATVSVSVTDVNDNSPQFSQSLYNVSVPETAAIGSPVLTLTATDMDINNNGDILYYLEPNVNTTFNMDPVGGVLTTISPLDYERQPRYQFRVTAIDRGIPPASSVATVLVNLINIDDECPRFENPVFIEELPYDVTGTPPAVGTAILTVMATDPDRFSEVTYSIVSEPVDVLALDSATGIITLARTDIDPRGQYTLNVSASDQNCTGRSFVRVEIGIGNVNDHSPQFQTACVATIPENPQRGTEVVTLLATDDDIGFNGLVTYFLLSGIELFAIDASSGIVRTNAPSESFDRETRSSFQAGVTASDGGNRQDYCLLTVTLTDVNDNPPRIPLSRYNTSLARSSQPDMFVVQVTADDPDVGDNGRILYSINVTSSPLTLPFQIDSESGVITTTEDTLPITIDSYMFDVVAMDMGPSVQLSSSATVSISLTDGTLFPMFDEFNYTGSVCENAPFQTTVVMVTASTMTMNDLIIYEIIPGSDYRSNLQEVFEIRRLSSGDAAIRVGSQEVVDFEMLAPNLSFQFFVQARNTAGSSIVPVEIFVTDIDDNLPEFSSDISITISENEPVGTTVAQVQAIDMDSGTNGEIMYRFIGGLSSPYFEITGDGVILSSQVFDFESSENIQGDIFVEAYNPNPVPSDSVCGSQGTRDSETTIIRWTVLDQNDNPPSFSSAMYFTQLPEDAPIQSKVFKLNATDPDISDLGRLSFSITSGNDGSFGIESHYIILTRRLDYETTPTYNLGLQVTDGVHSGQDCPMCVATVQISVSDVDDQPPVFSSPEYHANVVENAPIGTSVLTLMAVDTDSPSILYELRGLAKGRFSVAQSGVVSVSGAIDREEFPGGGLVFLAFAEGGSLATAIININIDDVNDYVPRFSGVFRGRVEENTSPGEEGLYVGEVRAGDLDRGENGTVSYSIISGGENGFVIDESTGVITAHAQYDREVMSSYVITVQARDNGSPVQLSSETLVTIDIGDVNDNQAFFPYTYMFARVFENVPLSDSVFFVPAIDPDNGTNATILYAIENFSPSELKYSLNPVTGEITVAGSLDYEIPQHRIYTLSISVRDPQYLSVGPSMGTLQISLLDQNDNAPVVTFEIEASNLQETFPPGNDVATVTASDTDSGVNGELIFEISDGNENGDFTLSVEDGVGKIRSTSQFDYETISSYILTVTVSDRGFPQMMTSVQLEFNILDVNDEHPVFTETVYSVDIEESSSPSDNLLQVEAFDRDTGNGGTVVRYEILDGNEGGWFSLTPRGELSSLVTFDREQRASYSLMIAAFDGGALPLSGLATIQVTIGDINDNPSFNGGHLTVSVYALNGMVTPGFIAPLYFIDEDVDDNFISCLAEAQTQSGTFRIDRDTCSIQLDEPNPAEGIYSFPRILGRDGVHVTVSTSATIVVSHIDSSEVPMDSIVTLTINVSSELFFIELLNVSFPVQLASVLGVGEEDVRVITVQRGLQSPDSTVDITFTVRDNNGIFLRPTAILQQLYVQREQLTIDGHIVLDIPLDACVSEPCQNQAGCRTVKTFVGTERVSSIREFVLFAPKIDFAYECVCVPGTSGDHCETNFDDCYSNPCQNGGQCTDEINGFYCECPEGFSGQDCSQTPKQCPMNICQNGGTCTISANSLVCDCLPGYYGPSCQYHYFRPSSFCGQDNLCQNEAECSAGRDGFSCICLPGFRDELCETETQLEGGCIGNPCYNGSTCIDTTRGYDCQCSVGFTGPNCQWPLNNCELGLCLNGATCEQGLYGSYRCSCMPGFTGDNCDQHTSVCTSRPCLNGGHCLDHNDGTYTCQCPPGYYGDNCEYAIQPAVDLCDTEDCSFNGNCTSGRDIHTCTCERGFSGVHCSVTDSSEQPCTANPCLYGGLCETDLSLPVGYRCMCSVGFTGPICETNIDECSNIVCSNGGNCIDGINGYICNCPSNFAGNECEVYCPEGLSGVFCQTPVLSCIGNTCQNGGTCMEGAGTFTCMCPPSHTGTRCENVNSCSLSSCLNGGTCIDLPDGGFQCDCSQDFSGDNCQLLTVSFTGSQGESSYRAYDSLNTQGQGSIDFEFATLNEDGLLLFNTQFQNGQSNDFIAVEMVGGALHVAVSHGNGDGSVLIVSSSVNVADGLWHRVSIETRGKEFQVLLDDCFLLPAILLQYASCIVIGTTPGTSSFLDLGLPLWLGGVPFSLSKNSTQISNQGITGCMRGVNINGEILDLEGFVSERNSQRGCVHLEPEVCSTNSSACGGGQCMAVWDGHVCECPQRTEGRACHKVASSVMFGGGTFAQYSLLEYQPSVVARRQSAGSLRSTMSDQISLWFRTEMNSGRGLLFYMGTVGDGDELYIQLEDGALVLHINLGSGEEQLLLSNSSITNSDWHHLEVKRSSLELTTSIDDVTTRHTLLGINLSLDISPNEIYAGGRPTSEGSDTIVTPYIGCMEDIRINQDPLPTENTNDFASVVFNGNSAISYNCALGRCLESPCGRGNCSERGTDNYACECEIGVATFSRPCPLEIPPPMYTLAIVFGAIAGGLILCVVTILLGMLCFKQRQNRKSSMMLDSSQDSSGTMSILNRQCLVISNEAGGGEQDTVMGMDEWVNTLIPNKHSGGVEKKSQSSSSSNTSIIKPPVGFTRANSPTIGAFIQDKLEGVPKEYRDMDSVCEYNEEGDYSETSSLSSICSNLIEGEYTVEKLKQSGPEFAPFVVLLASVLEEEDGDGYESGSEQAHTGNTQLTQATLYSQDVW